MAEVEKIKSKVFSDILSENRARFNTSFALARQKNISINDKTFYKYLTEWVEPLVARYENEEAAVLEKMVISLYDRILELLEKKILGSSGRYPYFDEVLYEFLNKFSQFTVFQTDKFISMISNAILNITTEVGGDIKTWAEKILNLHNDIDNLDQLTQCGVVAAWTCGMTPYRGKALEICGTLKKNVLSILLELNKGLETNIETFINNIKENPWTSPERLASGEKIKPGVNICHEGSFSGFGGDFNSPPIVIQYNDEIIVRDQNSYFSLHADIFGQVLIPADPVKADKKTGTSTKNIFIDENWTAVFNEKKFELPDKFHVPVSSQAVSGKTLCFTTALSHRVFIIGLST